MDEPIDPFKVALAKAHGLVLLSGLEKVLFGDLGHQPGLVFIRKDVGVQAEAFDLFVRKMVRT